MSDVVLRELYERVADRPGYAPPFASIAGTRQYRRLHIVFSEMVPGGTSVLDWGFGNGHFGLFLRRAGYDPVGFTIGDERSADWLGANYSRTVAGSADDPVSLPFAIAEFGAVASIGVLEHVRETGGDEAGSLREVARVLAPGGIFVCYHLPNKGSWIDALASLLPGKHHHRFRYTRGDVLRLMRDAGLETVLVECYGLLPRNTLWRLPAFVRGSRRFADAWDGLDVALLKVLNPIAQNFLVVARKPTGTNE